MDQKMKEDETFYIYRYTELINHEYFKESMDSAKKIGSLTLDLSDVDKFGWTSTEDFIYLANQLKDSNVENINLRNSPLDDVGLTAISEVLKYTKIKNLNLQIDYYDKNGLVAFTSALKESQVKVLDLSKNNLTDFEIHNLVDSLPFTNVTSLNLGNIDTDLSSLKHLSNTLASTKLTVLSLNSCQLSAEGIEYLSTKLSSSKIQSLNLSDNAMSFDSLKSLADVLENTVITDLNISSTQIETTGAEYLAEKLSKSVLQNLDIGWTRIKSEGCLAIGNVIHLTQIVKLNLRANDIDSSGITSLAENLKESNVRHLNLDRNNLKIDGAQILADGMKDSKLEYLNVNYNKLSNAGIGMILDALEFSKITDFDLDCKDNEMKKENMKFITNAFKCLKLKNLKLKLPDDGNIIGMFFYELKTLIESHDIDEILPIKNQMALSMDLNFEIYTGVLKYIFDVIKHFRMKELNFNDYYYFDEEEWIPPLLEMLMDIKNPISNIKTLYLGGTWLGDEGAIILAKSLKNLKLTGLDLDDTGIGNSGVIAIANELDNSHVRYLSLAENPFDSITANYLAHVVKKYPVRIKLNHDSEIDFLTKDFYVIKNINYMFLKAQLLVSSVSDNSPVKYDNDLIEHIKAYEIFKNVNLLWESIHGEPKYDYNRINSEIRSEVTKNFLKIIGVVNSDEISSDLLPTEIIVKICSYLNVNDIKFD